VLFKALKSIGVRHFPKSYGRQRLKFSSGIRCLNIFEIQTPEPQGEVRGAQCQARCLTLQNAVNTGNSQHTAGHLGPSVMSGSTLCKAGLCLKSKKNLMKNMSYLNVLPWIGTQCLPPAKTVLSFICLNPAFRGRSRNKHLIYKVEWGCEVVPLLLNRLSPAALMPDE